MVVVGKGGIAFRISVWIQNHLRGAYDNIVLSDDLGHIGRSVRE